MCEPIALNEVGVLCPAGRPTGAKSKRGEAISFTLVEIASVVAFGLDT